MTNTNERIRYNTTIAEFEDINDLVEVLHNEGINAELLSLGYNPAINAAWSIHINDSVMPFILRTYWHIKGTSGLTCSNISLRGVRNLFPLHRLVLKKEGNTGKYLSMNIHLSDGVDCLIDSIKAADYIFQGISNL